MIFTSNEKNGYFPCEFDSRFLIYINHQIKEVQLCILNDGDEYPTVVGSVLIGDEGKIKNAHNLGWKIKEEYRNQGLMKNLLALYLKEISLEGVCFSVLIKRENVASLKLAKSAGFTQYSEDDDFIYLKL